MKNRFAFALLLSTLAAGCASTTYQDKTDDARVRTAFEQPFRDVSWMRENPPDILVRAALGPYERINQFDCASILSEINALDLVLGPDLDQVLEEDKASDTDGNAILSGAIGSLIGLPYRGIVRRLSGAGKREEMLRKAILAGMVRRGFLKGVSLEAGCRRLDEPASDAPLRTQKDDG